MREVLRDVRQTSLRAVNADHEKLEKEPLPSQQDQKGREFCHVDIFNAQSSPKFAGGRAMTELSDFDRDRITRVETRVENLQRQVESSRGDFKELQRDFYKLGTEIRTSLAAITSKLSQPLDEMSGGKKVLIAIGGIIVFLVTVLNGILGAVAFFRPPHSP